MIGLGHGAGAGTHPSRTDSGLREMAACGIREALREWLEGMLRVAAVGTLGFCVACVTAGAVTRNAAEHANADPAAIEWRHHPSGTVARLDTESEGYYGTRTVYVIYVTSDEAFSRNTKGQDGARETAEIRLGGTREKQWRGLSVGDSYEWSDSSGDVVYDPDGNDGDRAIALGICLGAATMVLCVAAMDFRRATWT